MPLVTSSAVEWNEREPRTEVSGPTAVPKAGSVASGAVRSTTMLEVAGVADALPSGSWATAQTTYEPSPGVVHDAVYSPEPFRAVSVSISVPAGHVAAVAAKRKSTPVTEMDASDALSASGSVALFVKPLGAVANCTVGPVVSTVQVPLW